MIFVDTGAWYAIDERTDPDHERAKAVFLSNRQPFVTSDYVIGELLTLFAVRGQKRLGIQWRKDVLEAGLVQVVRVTEDDFAEALDIYERYVDKAWSFTDCTCYVLIRRLGIESAFSFDHHFQQFGIAAVVPERRE
jgi:predicted nucleic acid-binding protein